MGTQMKNQKIYLSKKLSMIEFALRKGNTKSCVTSQVTNILQPCLASLPAHTKGNLLNILSL